MIDYDKLKLAHELALKLGAGLSHYYDKHKTGDGEFELFHVNSFQLWGSHQSYKAEMLDDLISKLQELTQEIKPKYKDAWFINKHNVIECTKTENQEGYAYCDETSHDAFGKTMYPSREALIEAKIEYWNKLRYPTIEESARFAQNSIKELGEKLFKDNFECPKCNQEWSCCQCKSECQHEDSGIMDEIDNRLKCKKCGRLHE